MTEQEHILPSGLAGVLKKWTVGDLAIFANRQIAKKYGPAIEAELLKAAWVRTIDTGPYAFEGKPPWLGDILQGDLLDAIRQVRIMTWGDNLEYNFRCEDPFCRELIPVTIKLSDLETIELSSEGRDALANGNEIPWTFPECGKEIIYSLPTGRSMILGDKLSRQHGRALHVVWSSRIKKIEGVESPGRYADFLAALDPIDGQALEEEFERLNIGIETGVHLVCPECGIPQEQDVQFGADFFTPKKRSGKTS
jgi:predicted RNA-binding Zn-ribbon protein involved in translation (DUF1610 family)